MATQKYANCSGFLKKKEKKIKEGIWGGGGVVWRHDVSLKHSWHWHRFSGMTWIFTNLSEGRWGARAPQTENFREREKKLLSPTDMAKLLKLYILGNAHLFLNQWDYYASKPPQPVFFNGTCRGTGVEVAIQISQPDT